MKFLLLISAVFFTITPLPGKESPLPVPGALIIQLAEAYTPYRSPEMAAAARGRQPGAKWEILSRNYHIYRFHFDPAIDPLVMLAEVRNYPGVQAAQLDYELESRDNPDDPYFSEQWTMDRIMAPEAWNITTGGLTAGGDTIVVAITDSGFNPRHQDISANLWYNKGEIPNDGLDNDQNGFVDDDQGWNFKENNNRHLADSHGHKVAGIIGAKGNNGFGAAGVNWKVKLMLLTSTKISDLIAAYDYIITQRKRYNESDGASGAFVVAANLSLGLSRTFCTEQPVWGGMYDKLGEVGILAGVAAANENYNVEEIGDMPPSCTSDFIIAVTNTTNRDVKYERSAFGNNSVDMGAPGEGTVTIDLYEEFGLFSGNSAAAPHITGAIALLYSLPCAYLAENARDQPAQTALLIRQALLDGVDPLPALEGLTATGGRLNVFRSLQLLSQDCAASIGPLSVLKLYPNPTTGLVTIEIQTPDLEEYEIMVTNALGQEVYRERFSPLQAGPKKKSIDLGNLAGGMYVISLVDGKRRISKPLILH